MSYNKDRELGALIHQHLKSLGIESPFKTQGIDQVKLKILFSSIMEEIGLDLDDDSLADTPKRLAKLYGSEFFSGLDYNNFPAATVVDNKFNYSEMVLERNIQVRSLCEHHFLPIVGSAFVAYIPNKRVIGLSKLNRIVDFFSRRPQIQERLTAQIFETLKYLLETDNVAVIIEAEHMCVKLRGVEDPCSDTITSQLGGDFRRSEVRAEFIALSKGLKNE